MEKQPSSKILQLLSPQEWETLIDDFQSSSPSRQSKWISAANPLLLLDLALHSLLRRDFPANSKPQLLLFLEEFSHLLVADPSVHASPALSSIVDAVRTIVQSPAADPSTAFPYFIKEQAMVSATAVAISVDAVDHAPRQLESLVELLASVINRPNYGPDRQMRAVACECLRELENSCPCLLSEIAGHLWNLCQSERTHASQSYILLLTSVVHNIVKHGGSPSTISILSTLVPLVPFNIPSYLRNFTSEGKSRGGYTSGDGNLKEIRKVIAFLLERPQILTPLATMEMVSMLMRVVSVLELHGSVAALLKVQFFGLLYSYDPVLCHVVLMLYSHFSDAFAGDEQRIIGRLVHIGKEAQHPLVFRLLALHWLLGMASSRPPDRKGLLAPMMPSFYPTVFDPLALKALKLDVLADIASCLDIPGGGEKVKGEGRGIPVAKLLEDGLVCVSAFKWLPQWSTETSVAFRMLHKFFIGAAPHSDSAVLDISGLLESSLFHTLQSKLVELAFEYCGLVPVIASFLDRLMGCEAHRLVGERLLQKMDGHLLLKLTPDYRLTLYFPIFDRIAENTIPPCGLLELLSNYMVFLVEKHGPDTGLRSWSQGSKVLGICRTMLMHHHSSRVFLVLSRLLMFTCQFFPDLEVRDNARIYLRMLLCIPGKKLRHILNFGKQVLGVSPSPHPASFFQVPSPRPSQNLKKSMGVSTYIHLERVIPLLVKQSWSLTIPNWGMELSDSGPFEGIRDTPASSGAAESEEVPERNTDKITSAKEPLRVMDSKVAEILDILRKHFACIPDFRHMSGFKIKIPCTLRFESEPFNRVWAVDSFSPSSDGIDGLPALYASVIKFSSTSKYGSIPSCRVPFLLGEPAGATLGIVPIESGSQGNSSFRASVVIELEPREPMPGFVDVTIESNGENGQIISGSLQNITVGIEDMFLKAQVPSDIPGGCVAEYYSDLFDALWEACGNSANTGRETFPLKGGKGAAAISGTRSVKLLEVPSISLISSIEKYLAPFVVSVIGDPLVDYVRCRGVISDVVWKDDSLDSTVSDGSLVPYSESTPLQLMYIEDGNGAGNQLDMRKRNMGSFLVLIFLPPRFHLLFQMEVCQSSTLVRIRTDHWPCLAYIDEYLEALFFS